MGHYRLNAKNRDEWLAHRKDGIGASEVGTILGINPYETPYQLWLKKTGQVQQTQEENLPMRLGHLLEDGVAKLWSEETGREIIANSIGDWQYVSVEKPFLRVSPDRLYWLPGEKRNKYNRGILEIKTTQKPVSAEDFPRTWFCQVQMNLGVAELEKASLAWLISGRDFGYRDIWFDKDFFAFIAEEVERFWTDCVIGGKEPALSTIQDVIIKFPRHEEGKTVYATDDLVSLWGELKDTNAEIKRLDAHKTEIESAMKAAMLDAERLVIPAGDDNPERTIATWKASKDSSKFDVERFKAENPGLYESYLSPVAGVRRFSLK